MLLFMLLFISQKKVAKNNANLQRISEFCSLSLEFSLKHKTWQYLKTIVKNH